MDRHLKTIDAMLRIYCQDHHRPEEGLCEECRLLRDYAEQRLLHCPFQPKKPPCSKCTVHCYKPAMRERIRNVMRYAGPRMLGRHPLLACRHLWYKIRSRRQAVNIQSGI